jgi:hypothetical protein
MSKNARVELKGWKAVAALAVIAAVLAGKFLAERSTLESEAADEIKFWLRSEYLSHGMQDFDLDSMTEQEAEARAEELLSFDDVVFTSIKARGRGDNIVVRVEVEVAGKPPPTGDPVRYFKMTHSTVTGWRVKWETTALSYYLKLF